MEKKKIKYVKPSTLDLGGVAPILGAHCTGGSNAEGCDWGNDPTVIPYCDTGSVATGNCQPNGGQAGDFCNTGDNPSTLCYSGTYWT